MPQGSIPTHSKVYCMFHKQSMNILLTAWNVSCKCITLYMCMHDCKLASQYGDYKAENGGSVQGSLKDNVMFK